MTIPRLSQCADIRHVIIDSLELQQNRPHTPRAFGTSTSPIRSTLTEAVPCEKLESPETLSAKKYALLNGSARRFLDPFVGIKHTQLR